MGTLGCIQSEIAEVMPGQGEVGVTYAWPGTSNLLQFEDIGVLFIFRMEVGVGLGVEGYNCAKSD